MVAVVRQMERIGSPAVVAASPSIVTPGVPFLMIPQIFEERICGVFFLTAGVTRKVILEPVAQIYRIGVHGAANQGSLISAPAHLGRKGGIQWQIRDAGIAEQPVMGWGMQSGQSQ